MLALEYVGVEVEGVEGGSGMAVGSNDGREPLLRKDQTTNYPSSRSGRSRCGGRLLPLLHGMERSGGSEGFCGPANGDQSCPGR
jgi:hypothetical protein